MSQNLTHILAGEEGASPPTALQVLKQAVEERGEITDEDRRLAAERSGLPEATVYGISSFYDDFLQPRGRRHVSVCTGTACCVGDVSSRLGLAAGERSEDGELSLGETVCLGFCHTAGAVRDGDLVDAGEGAVERIAAGDARQAREPEGTSMLGSTARSASSSPSS
jgi:NADH:ubiquinone oxidoreductase subunit E